MATPGFNKAIQKLIFARSPYPIFFWLNRSNKPGLPCGNNQQQIKMTLQEKCILFRWCLIHCKDNGFVDFQLVFDAMEADGKYFNGMEREEIKSLEWFTEEVYFSFNDWIIKYPTAKTTKEDPSCIAKKKTKRSATSPKISTTLDQRRQQRHGTNQTESNAPQEKLVSVTSKSSNLNTSTKTNNQTCEPLNKKDAPKHVTPAGSIHSVLSSVETLKMTPLNIAGTRKTIYLQATNYKLRNIGYFHSSSSTRDTVPIYYIQSLHRSNPTKSQLQVCEIRKRLIRERETCNEDDEHGNQRNDRNDGKDGKTRNDTTPMKHTEKTNTTSTKYTDTTSTNGTDTTSLKGTGTVGNQDIEDVKDGVLTVEEYSERRAKRAIIRQKKALSTAQKARMVLERKQNETMAASSMADTCTQDGGTQGNGTQGNGTQGNGTHEDGTHEDNKQGDNMQKGDNEKDSVEWKDIELNQSWYETIYVEMEDYYQYREDTTWLESVYGTECYICYEPMTKTQSIISPACACKAAVHGKCLENLSEYGIDKIKEGSSFIPRYSIRCGM